MLPGCGRGKAGTAAAAARPSARGEPRPIKLGMRSICNFPIPSIEMTEYSYRNIFLLFRKFSHTLSFYLNILFLLFTLDYVVMSSDSGHSKVFLGKLTFALTLMEWGFYIGTPQCHMIALNALQFMLPNQQC